MAASLADDEAALAVYASQLADALDAALPSWVRGCIANHASVDADPADVEREIATAVDQVNATTAPRIRELLGTDIAEQRTNPLDLIRSAVAYPTDALRRLGAPPVARAEFETSRFPDDTYDLSPASFADVDESLHEPGLVWGAAKAHVHLRRRREMAPVTTVAAFAPDLMDQSKLRGAIDDLVMLRNPAALASTDAAIVLVDLGRPGVLDVIDAIAGRVIGFGSHVDDALLAAAEAAGCDEVMARSVFFSRLAKGTLLAS